MGEYSQHRYAEEIIECFPMAFRSCTYFYYRWVTLFSPIIYNNEGLYCNLGSMVACFSNSLTFYRENLVYFLPFLENYGVCARSLSSQTPPPSSFYKIR